MKNKKKKIYEKFIEQEKSFKSNKIVGKMLLFL